MVKAPGCVPLHKAAFQQGKLGRSPGRASGGMDAMAAGANELMPGTDQAVLAGM